MKNRIYTWLCLAVILQIPGSEFIAYETTLKPNIKMPNSMRYVDLQGHRGSRGIAHGNTMRSFKKAVRAGMTSIEVDVQITRDLRFIIFHDFVVSRRTCVKKNGKKVRRGFIPKLRWKTLKKYKCKTETNRFIKYSRSKKRFRIITLEEFFRKMKQFEQNSSDFRLTRYNLDLKLLSASGKKQKKIARKLLKIIEKAGMTSRVIIQSFHLKLLKKVKKMNLDVKTSALFLPSKALARYVWQGRKKVMHRKLIRAARKSKADMISLHWYYINKAFVKKCHKYKIKVIAYPLNKKKHIERMLNIGVDILMTDFPHLLYKTWRNWSGKPGYLAGLENSAALLH